MSSISVTIVQSLSMVTQPIMTSALCFQDFASNIEDACLAIVCRDRPSLPFRCLDPQYRRELVRVYLTNVEGICRRFVEEKQESLLRIRETAASFKAYWISQSASEPWCVWKYQKQAMSCHSLRRLLSSLDASVR